jgi:TonB family protein
MRRRSVIQYREMVLTQNTAKRVLSSLLITLALLSVARAQQPVGEQPSANVSNAPDNNHDAKLAIYQVHRLADKILNLRSVPTKAVEVARLASVLWNYDETHARFLFEKALNLTIANGSDPDQRALSISHRRVIALVARNDAEWAKRLIDAAAKRDLEDERSKNFTRTNIATALDLLDEDSPVAAQFAERSLKGGVHEAFVDFLLDLRKKDEPTANSLFVQALTHLAQQPAVNVLDFNSLGLYLFSSPDNVDTEHHVFTLIEHMLVPNITADRPNVPRALVRAYLATAADVLWRMTSDAEQRKYSYALCYMLLPKSRIVAPDLTAKFDAVMAALSPEVPAALTRDTAYRYLNQPPTTTEEKLTKAENKPDQESRDLAYLEIALQAWRKGDFKTARVSQGRISILEASQRLAAIIDFGEGAWTIKQNARELAQAESLANRLPEGVERSVLLQAIANIQAKGPNANLTEETISNALKAARSISDARRPFLLLTATAQLANLKSPAAYGALAEAVKSFNSFEAPALADLDWAQTIQVGPQNARFPLEIANVDFSFSEAFRTIAFADPEAAMAQADELRHENLRAQALVEVARAFLEKIPPKEAEQNELPIRVGEDGMRKSASKTVMPSYPDDAVKKRQQGVAVVELEYDAKGDVVSSSILEAPAKSIGDAVIAAVKQWKFVPSKKRDGTPVSVRGKLTFYFEIDNEGKGRVQNPKQYR